MMMMMMMMMMIRFHLQAGTYLLHPISLKTVLLKFGVIYHAI